MVKGRARRGENLRQATFIVMFSLFLSRILGLVREMIIAGVYGKGNITDAYFAAFTIPDFMFSLLVGGALSSGFMPVFTSYLAKDDEEGAWKAANSFLTVGFIFIGVFNLVGILFAKQLIPIVANGIARRADVLPLTIKLTRIMFSSVTFLVLSGLARGILNSYKRFSSSSAGPVLYNIGTILGAVLLGRALGIYGLAIGVVAGAILSLAVQLPDFKDVGKRFRLELDLKNPGFRRMLRLMGPGMIGLGINQLYLVINQNIASLMGSGDISAIRYSSRVMLVPLGIFATAISTTVFPNMSMQIAKKQIEEYKDSLSLGLRTIMFVTIPSAVGMMVLSKPIIRLLFQGGKFTEADVVVTASALAFYGIALIGQSGTQIILRGFYAVQDTKTPVKIGGMAVVINVIVNLFFVLFTPLRVGGIALSTTISSMYEMLIDYKKLKKKMRGLRTMELARSCTKAVMASIVMAAAAVTVSRFLEGRFGYATKLHQLIDAGGAITAAIIVYFAAAILLKMKELDFVMGILKRRFNKGKA